MRSEISEGKNPRDVKVNLAKLIIKDFHSAEAAQGAEDEFVRRFVEKAAPTEMDEVSVEPLVYRLADLVVASGLVASKGEARRVIEQGGVKIDGEKATAGAAEIDLSAGGTLVIQVGKLKFARLKA